MFINKVKPSDSSSEVEAVSALQKCICDVRAWMREDQLMLNDDKTQFLIIGTRQQVSKVSIQSIEIGQTEVSPVASAHNLGTWFDTCSALSIIYTIYVILGNIYPENLLRN